MFRTSDIDDQNVKFSLNLSYGDSNENAPLSDAVQEGIYLRFIFWGIVVPIIASFGLVGNILTMVVLFRREMQSATTLYLRALVITDTILLIVTVVALTPISIAEISTDFRFYKDVIYPLTFTYMNYALMATQTCNVWITVAVSVERYVAICHPFVTSRVNTQKNTRIVIIAVVVFSVVYNIPRLFAVASGKCEKGDRCYFYTTQFEQGLFYRVIYHQYMYVIIVFAIPLTALVVLNICIIVELLRMAKRRRDMGTNIRNGSEANLSLVLVLIVVVFTICQTPGLIAQFHIFTNLVLEQFIAISNTMFVLNSSINFLIYIFVGRRFREVFVENVLCRSV